MATIRQQINHYTSGRTTYARKLTMKYSRMVIERFPPDMLQVRGRHREPQFVCFLGLTDLTLTLHYSVIRGIVLHLSLARRQDACL
jgi:hypothetical protein